MCTSVCLRAGQCVGVHDELLIPPPSRPTGEPAETGTETGSGRTCDEEEGGAGVLVEAPGGRVRTKGDFAARWQRQWVPSPASVGAESATLGSRAFRSNIGPGGVTLHFNYRGRQLQIEGNVTSTGDVGPSKRRATFDKISGMSLVRRTVGATLFVKVQGAPTWHHFNKASGGEKGAPAGWSECGDGSDEESSKRESLWRVHLSDKSGKKLREEWGNVEGFFPGCSLNVVLADGPIIESEGAAAGGEGEQEAATGLQHNVEPVVSHPRETVEHVKNILGFRTQLRPDLDAAVAGREDPEKVYSVIDPVLEQCLRERRRFEHACAKQPAAVVTRDAVTLDLGDEDADSGGSESGDSAEEGYEAEEGDCMED